MEELEPLESPATASRCTIATNTFLSDMQSGRPLIPCPPSLQSYFDLDIQHAFAHGPSFGHMRYIYLRFMRNDID